MHSIFLLTTELKDKIAKLKHILSINKLEIDHISETFTSS